MHTYIHRGDVTVTVGKQAFDSSETPTASDQMPAGPVLMFKAPPGTVFLAPVEIAIPVSKSIIDMLNSNADEADEGARRRLLAIITTTQELKQAWFNSASKVRSCFAYVVCTSAIA
jgi:hypothetical protein